MSNPILGAFAVANNERNGSEIEFGILVEYEDTNITTDVINDTGRRDKRARINSRFDEEINYLYEVDICISHCHLIFYSFNYT